MRPIGRHSYSPAMSPVENGHDVSLSPHQLTLELSTGETARFNRYWLRDNCPSNGERLSLFRAFSVAELDEQVTLTDATLDSGGLEITFSDGFRDRFPLPWLLDQHRRLIPAETGVEPWRAGHQAEVIDFGRLVPGSDAHLRLAETIVRFGFALIDGIPDDEGATGTIADLLGPIRETDFGRIFDIISEPEAFTPSQTDHGLDPHTDDPYRYTPAGVSILHCMTPSSNGGESSMVDGFAIAEDLRTRAPQDFELLATVNVGFVHRRTEVVDQGGDVHLRALAPIIACDQDGRVSGIRFHERAMDTLAIDPDLAERYYPALQHFARAVRGDDYRWLRGLRAGEAIVYDNQRVLHGRTPFTGSSSRRHFRLCTIDRDQTHSRLRRLREQFATGTEYEVLPSGNLSR